MMPYKFITVEGNIGAGKTTLSQLLQQKLGARLILEQFADNPFLPKFYEDQQRFAFPLELSFLADRYKQLRDVLNTYSVSTPFQITCSSKVSCLRKSIYLLMNTTCMKHCSISFIRISLSLI
jgi:hypothetical protein